MDKFEYLLIKRNGNKDGLVYNQIWFKNSADARKQFRKNDTLLKCKADSIHYDGFSWTVNQEDVIKEYKK